MAEKPDAGVPTEQKSLEEERDQLRAIHRMTTRTLEKARIAEYTQSLNRPLIWTNVLAGPRWNRDWLYLLRQPLFMSFRRLR